jgi:hypothetical protein
MNVIALESSRVTGSRGWVSRPIVVMAAIALALSVVLAPSSGEASEDQPCTFGEARALFEAMPPLFHFKPLEGTEEYPDCQFRLFWHGETVTFTEDDWFLAGAVGFVEYRDLDLSRHEAIAELDRFTSRLWFAPVSGGVVGDVVEQALMESGFKSFRSPVFGLVVYKHVGVITRLPAGEYLSAWDLYFDEVLVQRFEVTIHILPSG